MARRYLSNSSKAWLQRHTSDKFVKQSVKENMRSRSAYKLIEMQNKFKFIQSNHFVIDVGCAPGGWSLAVSKLLGGDGKIIAIDLLDMEPIENVHFIKGDFTDKTTQQQLLGGPNKDELADVIMSDMLHNTTGHKSTDHFRSMDLCFSVLDFSFQHLRPQTGTFLCKYLRGSDDIELLSAARKSFAKVHIVKPEASRSESSEAYLLAMGYKGTINP